MVFVGFCISIGDKLSDATTPAVKETKAQKVERLKREKNPWTAWDEVRQFAREGRGSVLPEWTGTYFKWWGVYTQGDGAGVTGGSGGEGKASEFFMMRIGLPNGLLTSRQLHAIADITAKTSIVAPYIDIRRGRTFNCTG